MTSKTNHSAWLAGLSPIKTRIMSALFFAYPRSIDPHILADLSGSTAHSIRTHVTQLRKRMTPGVIVSGGYGSGYVLGDDYYVKISAGEAAQDPERHALFLDTREKIAKVKLPDYAFGRLSPNQRSIVVALLPYPEGLSAHRLVEKTCFSYASTSLRRGISLIRKKVGRDAIITKTQTTRRGYRLGEDFRQKLLASRVDA